MAITFVSQGVFTLSGAIGTKTISFSGATRSQDDIVIIGVATDGAATLGNPVMVTAGYSYLFDGEGDADVPNAFLWKRLGASPDSDVQLSQSTASVIVAGLWQIWRGVDTTTAIDNSVTTTGTGTTGTPNAPSHTTVTNNALRIIMGVVDDDDAASSAAAPAGYTTNPLFADTGQASTAAGATVFLASKLAATAGAEDPAAFTSSATDNWRAYHCALRPATGTAASAILTTAGAIEVEGLVPVASTTAHVESLAATGALEAEGFAAVAAVTAPVVALAADGAMEAEGFVPVAVAGSVSPGIGTPVNKGTDVTGTSTGSVAATGLTSGAGLLAVCCSLKTTAAVTGKATVSDTQSLVWTEIADQAYDPGSGNRLRLTVYSATANGNDSTVSMVTNDSTQRSGLAMILFPGAGIPGANKAFGTSAAGDPSATITTPAAGSAGLVLGYFSGTFGFTDPTGYTHLIQAEQASGPSATIKALYDLTSPATTAAFVSTNTNSIALLMEIPEAVAASTQAKRTMHMKRMAA